MSLARVNGVKLHYEITGTSGDGLVLVHGSWVDSTNWDAVVPGLAETFRVLTFDRRGYSRSERRPERGGTVENVGDLAALVEEVGFAPAHIVGNSHGASIVLSCAAAHPDIFRSLIVHEPPLYGVLADEREYGSVLAEIGKRIDGVLELLRAGDAEGGARSFVEMVAAGEGAWDRMPPVQKEIFIKNAYAWAAEVRDPKVATVDLSALSGFPHPTLLTYGGRGLPYFQPILRKISSAVPQTRLKEFADAGHMPQWSHADEFVEVVRAFARGAGDPSATRPA